MVVINPGYHGRRHERLRVDMPARTLGKAGEQKGIVQDISESGAAIATDNPIYSNDQFVELHIEGHQRLSGRVVREFQGGYALAFEDNKASQMKMAEDIEKFRKIAGRKIYVEG